MKELLSSVAISTILCCSLAQKAAAEDTPPHAVFQKFSDLKWEKTPDGNQDIAILHVNPESKAMELIIPCAEEFPCAATLALGERDAHHHQRDFHHEARRQR